MRKRVNLSRILQGRIAPADAGFATRRSPASLLFTNQTRSTIMPNAEEKIERVWSLIKDTRIAMVVTHNGRADELRARPMRARPDAERGAIYFLTDAAAPKDDEVRRNDSMCLTFADGKGQQFVSVTGRGEISNDRAKIKQLWAASDKIFWRDENDPAIRILCLVPEEAEYWEGAGFLATSVKMVASAVTGAKADLGDNEKVRFPGAARA
jgi:general stress protein 26